MKIKYWQIFLVIGLVIAVFIITIFLGIRNGNRSSVLVPEPEETEVPVLSQAEEKTTDITATEDIEEEKKGPMVIVNEQDMVVPIAGDYAWVVKKAIAEYVFQKDVNASEATCLDYQSVEGDSNKIRMYFLLDDENETFLMVTYDMVQHLAVPAEADIGREQIITKDSAPAVRDVFLPEEETNDTEGSEG